MLKIKFFTLLLLTTLVTEGQVINTLSSDKSNIYFHALDSVVKILKKSEFFDLVTVYGDRSITQYFPDTVDNTKLTKPTENTKRIPKIKKEEARLIIRNIQIIRDEFKVSIMAWGHNGRLGEGLYIFRYQYIPDTMTYQLKEIKSGIML